MSKDNDPVNYVLTGNRFQVLNDDGQATPEYGVGMFRSGIRLQLATNLYEALVERQIRPPFAVEVKLEVARELAAKAFALSDVFLEEMDKHFRRPAPSGNNNA